jgi:hypothetical protein
MKLLFAQTIGLPTPGDKPITESIKDFAVDKIARPVKTAGEKTGEAVKDAAGWVKDRFD